MIKTARLDEITTLSQPYFTKLWNRVFPGSNGAAVWENLVDSYAYPEGRAYHNLGHVQELLGQLYHNTPEFSEATLDEMAIAIYFHDAVYFPGATNNELNSANLFEHNVSTYDCSGSTSTFQLNVVRRIYAMIMATTHMEPCHTPEAQYVCDLDLWGMGSSWATYSANGAKIRREFAHVPEDDWKVGRAKFITMMLGRKIYYNPLNSPRVEQLEEQARLNLNRELVTL